MATETPAKKKSVLQSAADKAKAGGQLTTPTPMAPVATPLLDAAAAKGLGVPTPAAPTSMAPAPAPPSIFSQALPTAKDTVGALETSLGFGAPTTPETPVFPLTPAQNPMTPAAPRMGMINGQPAGSYLSKAQSDQRAAEAQAAAPQHMAPVATPGLDSPIGLGHQSLMGKRSAAASSEAAGSHEYDRAMSLLHRASRHGTLTQRAEAAQKAISLRENAGDRGYFPGGIKDSAEEAKMQAARVAGRLGASQDRGVFTQRNRSPLAAAQPAQQDPPPPKEKDPLAKTQHDLDEEAAAAAAAGAATTQYGLLRPFTPGASTTEYA